MSINRQSLFEKNCCVFISGVFWGWCLIKDFLVDFPYSQIFSLLHSVIAIELTIFIENAGNFLIKIGFINFAYAFIGVGGDTLSWICRHVCQQISACVSMIWVNERKPTRLRIQGARTPVQWAEFFVLLTFKK